MSPSVGFVSQPPGDEFLHAGTPVWLLLAPVVGQVLAVEADIAAARVPRLVKWGSCSGFWLPS